MHATHTNDAAPTRRTLASQLDRLDAIVDGLGEALDGAVAEAVSRAVETAVRQAVSQAVRETVEGLVQEVVSNPELQHLLRQAARPTNNGAEKGGRGEGRLGRLCSAARETLQRAVRTVKSAGRGVGVALLAVGGAVAAGLYMARKPIAAAASFLYSHGKCLVGKVGSVLGRLLPPLVFCGS